MKKIYDRPNMTIAMFGGEGVAATDDPLTASVISAQPSGASLKSVSFEKFKVTGFSN